MRALSKEQVKIELEYIQDNSSGNILLDEEDIELLTENTDIILMGACEITSENAAYDTISNVISDLKSSEFYSMDIKSMLIHFKMNPKYDVNKLANGLELTHFIDNICIDDEPDMFFGVNCSDDLDIDYIKSTLFFCLSKKEKLTPVLLNNP